MATLAVRPLVEMIFSISLLMMPWVARTPLLDRWRWNTSEPVMIPSHAAAETAVNYGQLRGQRSKVLAGDLLSQMRTPQVFSGKRTNWTSWKIHTVEAVANAAPQGKSSSARSPCPGGSYRSWRRRAHKATEGRAR